MESGSEEDSGRALLQHPDRWRIEVARDPGFVMKSFVRVGASPISKTQDRWASPKKSLSAFGRPLSEN